jgi:hypothetical protein
MTPDLLCLLTVLAVAGCITREVVLTVRLVKAHRRATEAFNRAMQAARDGDLKSFEFYRDQYQEHRKALK